MNPALAEVTKMPARDRPTDRLHQPVLDKIHPRSWWRLADLHAICTRSASLLHTRELRCCDKGQGWQGGICAVDGMARLR